MSTIAIRDEFAELLSVLGNVESEVDDALRRYLLDRASERMDRCREEIQHLEQVYSLSFDDLVAALASEDSPLLDKIERQHPTWEADYNTWETYTQELERWKKRVFDLLMR